jgi:hypothetical protein
MLRDDVAHPEFGYGCNNGCARQTQRRSILNEGARASFGAACSTTTEEAVVAVGRPRAHNASIEAQ